MPNLLNLNLSANFNCPEEVYGHVLEYMDVASLNVMRSLSRDWHLFINQHPYNRAWDNLFQKLWDESITAYANLGYSPYDLFMHRFRLLGLPDLDQGLRHINTPNVVSQINTVRKIISFYFFNTLLTERKREQVLNHCSHYLGNFISQFVEINLTNLRVGQEEGQRWMRAVVAYQNYQILDPYFIRINSALMAHCFRSPLHSMSIQRLKAKWLLHEATLLARSQNNLIFNHPGHYRRDYSWLSKENLYLNFINAQNCLTIWKQLTPHAFDELTKSLLFFAAKNQYWEVIAVLIAERDCATEDEAGRNALHYLSSFSLEDDRQKLFHGTLNALIDQGCSILKTDRSGFSSLALAVESGNLNLLDFFLDHIKEEDREVAIGQIARVLNQYIDEYDDKELDVLELMISKDFYPALDSSLFLEMLVQSQWYLLTFLSSKTHLQIQKPLFDNLFDYLEYDSSQNGDISGKLDSFSEILPKIEAFLYQVSKQTDLDCYFDDTPLLHRCIQFFENEMEEIGALFEQMRSRVDFKSPQNMNFDIHLNQLDAEDESIEREKINESNEEKIDDHQAEDYEILLELLKESYFTCVRSLTNQKNLNRSDVDGQTPIDLVSDRESDVYRYLLEQKNPPKRRRIDTRSS